MPLPLADDAKTQPHVQRVAAVVDACRRGSHGAELGHRASRTLAQCSLLACGAAMHSQLSTARVSAGVVALPLTRGVLRALSLAAIAVARLACAAIDGVRIRHIKAGAAVASADLTCGKGGWQR